MGVLKLASAEGRVRSVRNSDHGGQVGSLGYDANSSRRGSDRPRCFRDDRHSVQSTRAVHFGGGRVRDATSTSVVLPRHWRHPRGRRCGYAPSPTAGPFDFASLTSDVLALIDRWSPGRAIELVGHDWGALMTHDACATAPDRIRRAVALAVPHPLTFLTRPNLAQLRRSWYMGFFQLPGSGVMATARDLALIDRLWRQWSPNLLLDPALRADLHEHLHASMPAPMRYYRAMLRPRILGATRRLSQPITVPMLQLHGADDGCFLPPRVDDRHRFSAPRAREVVPDVGHFLHIEAPKAIAEGTEAWAQ